MSAEWKDFFKIAEGWTFQAAPINNAGKLSLGSLESIYQVFKARLAAEREAELASEREADLGEGGR